MNTSTLKFFLTFKRGGTRRVPEAKQRMAFDALTATSARPVRATVVTFSGVPGLLRDGDVVS